ncbi:MAG: hypothetical protein HY049_11935 [Acidobacteria bacterium]|nr:hypothetical protein [Acidobacteriota bacterium]
MGHHARQEGHQPLGLAAGALVLIAFTGVFSGAARADQPDEHDQHSDHTDIFKGGEFSPKFTLHGFADVTGSAQWPRPAQAGQSSFSIGALDLYMVSRLANNISFLGETVFESDENGKAKVDVERLAIKYTLSDHFWLALGRNHTALGYWNEAFHHGAFLQPTVERPEGLKFEDEGGDLPVHEVGIATGGRWFHGPWGFEYGANLANGRATTSERVQNSVDKNDKKSFTLRLTVSRERKRRFLFGPMIHLDLIPADPLIPGRAGEISERILGAHAAFLSDRIDLITEYYAIRHEDQLTGAIYNHPTYFAIVEWKPGKKWKPYAGYDRMALDESDPFYAGFASALTRKIVGVRWDLHPFNAIKFEYNHDDRLGIRSHGIIVQTAFTF